MSGDRLSRRRLDKPYSRKGGKLVEANLEDAFGEIASVARNAGNSVAAVAGDLLDCETMFAARQLVKALGGTMLEGRQTGLNYDVSNLAAVHFNSTDRQSVVLGKSVSFSVNLGGRRIVKKKK